MEKNIMLAFVSTVSPKSLNEPIDYPDIQGRPYRAIQTNESAIVFVERMLNAKNNSLSKIFLIVSDAVQTGKVAPDNEFGDITHLEFLQRRITKEFPQLADKFSNQDYSEKAKEGEKLTVLEKNILQTAEIADAVMKFAQENSNDKIIVHADMTGGFRHASMLMLSIIQLLKYRGIETNEVLYSDPSAKVVYSVTEIQRMFLLITGADEFVKFGSVEALQEYFGKNPSDAVDDLLNAMNRFSEAIKICRTSAIEGELENLGKHIKTFRENSSKDLKSELFAKIIDTIEVEYGNLISGTAGRLEIIRWCMKKGFWQQAMTLCTEWLPEEIVARKICTPKDISIVNSCKSKGRSNNKTWQQYFIVDYKEKSSDKESIVEEDLLKEICNDLHYLLKNFSAKIVNNEKISSELRKFFNEYNAGKNEFKKRFPSFSSVLQAIYDERKTGLNYRKNFYEFLKSVEYKKIPLLLVNFPNKKLVALFKIDLKQIAKKNSEPVEKSESKWENREKEYREMFSKKTISLKPDKQSALEILRSYFEIRRERNQVNHANAQASKTISELKTMIENYFVALEKVQA